MDVSVSLCLKTDNIVTKETIEESSFYHYNLIIFTKNNTFNNTGYTINIFYKIKRYS